MEWTTSTFGYLSTPVFVVGIVCYFFPDFLYKIFVLIRYREIKPNHEFEDNPPNSDIPKHRNNIKSIRNHYGFLGDYMVLVFRRVLQLIILTARS
ncbi:hypothetical protein SAMN04487896_3158 [Paenibacillus sp. ov031]|nr:hypothetical protein SAMN04487896_3158 [Paenibacillus sp. ov031]